MHPRNTLLGMADLCVQHEKTVPLDTLAQADAHGFLLTEFGEPQSQNNETEEGDALYGSTITETDIHDL